MTSIVYGVASFDGGTGLFNELQHLWGYRHWRWGMAAVGVAALVAALLGGFERAGPAAGKLPLSGANKTIESKTFAVTPLCAWSSNLRPGQPASMAGNGRYLMLRARVVNKVRDGLAVRAYLDKDVIWLPAGKGDPVGPERSQRADDATLAFHPGPGLPVVVDFIWDLPAGMATPTRSTWGMFKRRHVERSYASGEEMWVQDGPGWKFELPVGQSCSGVSS